MAREHYEEDDAQAPHVGPPYLEGSFGVVRFRV